MIFYKYMIYFFAKIKDIKQMTASHFKIRNAIGIVLGMGLLAGLIIVINTLPFFNTDSKSRAQTSTDNNIEAENGITTGNVQINNDANASGGKYISFGSITSTITPTPVEFGRGIPPELIPFDQPPLSTLHSSSKLVLAHWHQYAYSRDNKDPSSDTYNQAMTATSGFELRLRPLARKVRPQTDWIARDARIDIKSAQNIGLDGFLVNVTKDYNNPFAWPNYVSMLKIAKEYNSGFYVAPNIDCAAYSTGDRGSDMAMNVVNYLNNAGEKNNPNQLKADGKFVFGSFYSERCGIQYWRDMRSTLSSNGLSPFHVCVFLNAGYKPEYNEVCDAWSDWGMKDPWAAAYSDYSSRYAGAGDEPIMAAISHGDVRYIDNQDLAYENKNTETLRVNWDEAINTGADWAQLVTWNDIGEHSQFFPNTAEQFAFYDLTAYYIAWFKTGQKPNINKDALYYSHRIAKVPPAPALRNGSWSNLIEVVAFLTAPATVEIITASGTTTKNAEAGVQVVTAPMPDSGKPRFRIIRNGSVTVDTTSNWTVGPMPARNDVVYRAGGSLRSNYGLTNPAANICTISDQDTCLKSQGEPLWLTK